MRRALPVPAECDQPMCSQLAHSPTLSTPLFRHHTGTKLTTATGVYTVDSKTSIEPTIDSEVRPVASSHVPMPPHTQLERGWRPKRALPRC